LKEDVICTILQRKSTWDKERIRHLLEEEIKNLPVDFTDIKKDISSKVITRKKFTFTENTCQARIWNEGFGGQCSSQKKTGDLCQKHHNILSKNGYLWLGYISEDKPMEPVHYDGRKHKWTDI